VTMSGLTDSRLFVPRLSAQASAELSQLQTIVSQVVLSSARDNRRGPFCLPQSKLDSGSLYRLLQSKDAPPHPAAKFIWETRAPPRVQFFIWLMVHGRVQCRTNLFRKTILIHLYAKSVGSHMKQVSTLPSNAPLRKCSGKSWGFSHAYLI